MPRKSGLTPCSTPLHPGVLQVLQGATVVAGLDPGAEGALCVVREGVATITTWRKNPEASVLVRALEGVSVIAIEAWTRRPGDRMGVTSWVSLVGEGMRLSGICEAIGVRVLRPTVDEWRSKVLGLRKSHDGDTAKLAAGWACWGGGWSRSGMRLSFTVPDADRSTHVAEGACLAEYARLVTTKGAK